MSYSFSLEFQEHLIASVLNDRKFLRKNLSAFRPEFFGDDVLKGIAEVVAAFFKKYKDVPSSEAIMQEVEPAPGRTRIEYEECLESIGEKLGVDSEYYQGKIVEWARTQSVGNALRESAVFLESGDVDSIKRSIDSALRVGAGLQDQHVYNYLSSTKKRVKEYKKNGSLGERLATGFYPLDEAMNGGLARGELGVIVAPPKHGKTTTLVNIGSAALLAQKKVIYVTLELSRKMIAAKFDSRLIGMTPHMIKKKPKKFLRAIEELRDKLTGGLTIAEYPTKGVTVDQIGGMVESNGGADLVLIDYAQLVRTHMKREESWYRLTEIYEDLRRMAGELKTRVWTAHQGNRPSATSKVLRMEHIAGDFNVAGICDVGISVNQTDEERAQGRLRYYVFASRIGDSGRQTFCDVNWKLATVKVSGDEPDEELN